MEMTPGQVCYEAYRTVMERKHAPGLSLPDWSRLDRVMRLSYEAGAQAVLAAREEAPCR
jgi:hypothetical protein